MVQQLVGGDFQDGLRLGVAGKDGAVKVHPDDPGFQGLLEKVEDAFHLDGAVEHPLDAVGVLRQGGEIGLEGGAVQPVLALQVEGQLDEGVGAKEPGPQVDDLLHPVRDIPPLPGGDGAGEVGRLRRAGVVGVKLHLPHPQLVQQGDGLGSHWLVDVHQQRLGVPGQGHKTVKPLPRNSHLGDNHRSGAGDNLGKLPADEGAGGDKVDVRRGDLLDGPPLDAVSANLDMLPQKIPHLAGVKLHRIGVPGGDG